MNAQEVDGVATLRRIGPGDAQESSIVVGRLRRAAEPLLRQAGREPGWSIFRVELVGLAKSAERRLEPARPGFHHARRVVGLGTPGLGSQRLLELRARAAQVAARGQPL